MLNSSFHHPGPPHVSGCCVNAVLGVATPFGIQAECGKWLSLFHSGFLTCSSVLTEKSCASQRAFKGLQYLLQEDFEERDVLPLPFWAVQPCMVCNGPEKINWTLHLRDKGWNIILNNLVTPINLCPQTF